MTEEKKKTEHQKDTIGTTRKYGRPRKRVRVITEKDTVRLVEEEDVED